MNSILSKALVVLLVSLATVNTNAQIGIGIQGGFLSSSQTGTQIINGQEEDIDSDNVIGYVVGIPLEIGLSKVFALQTELNLLRRGYKYDGTGFLPETSVSYDVLEIPVLAKLGYTSDKYSLAAVFGPSFQYIASGRAKVEAFDNGIITVQATDNKIDFDQDIYEDINRTNVYGQAGIQLGVPIGFAKFIVDGRYRFSVSDEDASDEVEIRGRGISATAGLLITLGDY